MSKRLISLLLAAILMFSMAACGTTNNNAANNTATPATEEINNEQPTENNTETDSAKLPENLKIAYAAVTTSLAPWVIALANNMQEMCDRNGWTLTMYDGEGNPSTQTEQINSIIADHDVDLVILFPADSEVGITYVQQLNAAGIPVLTLGSDVTEAGQAGTLCYVGPSQDALVKYGADYIIDKFGKDTALDYVILSGWDAQYDYKLREAAVNADFADTNYNQLAVKYCGASRDTAFEEMSNLLTTYDKIDFVFALSDEFALGAIQAIAQAGRTDEITVVSLEAFQEGLNAVENGTLAVTVTMRADKVIDKLEEVLTALIAGETLAHAQPSEIVGVTIDNVKDVSVEY